MTRPGPTLLPALAAGALSVTACSGGTGSPDLAATSYQTRSDVAVRAFEVQVTNRSNTTVDIATAELRSAMLTAPATAARGATLGPGQVVDLKVALPAPTCPPVVDVPEARLTGTASGSPFEVTVTAPDRLGQLARVTTAECAQEQVAAAVAITAPDRVTAPLALVYRVRPRGTIHLGAPGPTTLLTPITAKPVPVTVRAGDPPLPLVLRYEPTRCDAHAIAEDKQGTLLPLTARVPGRPATRLTLPMTASLRSQIQKAVARACGLD